MLFELAVLTGITGIIAADKSSKIDEKAWRTYTEAFEKDSEARMILSQKKDFTEKRLNNVVKKKRAIIKYTVPAFADVYGKIQKVEIKYQDRENPLELRASVDNKLMLNYTETSEMPDRTDLELLSSLIVKGFAQTMIADSKQNLSVAKSQLRAANVVESQSKSYMEVCDTIIARADRIADVLKTLNAMLVASTQKVEAIIQKNGTSIRNYSQQEKEMFMTCVNLAGALSDVMNVPVIEVKEEIAINAEKMLITGEEYIRKMRSIIG